MANAIRGCLKLLRERTVFILPNFGANGNCGIEESTRETLNDYLPLNLKMFKNVVVNAYKAIYNASYS
jgi:hypothetical protein